MAQARHSVNSPIIVARNGCKALQGSSQIRRAQQAKSHSPAAVVREGEGETTRGASRRAASGEGRRRSP